MVAPRPSAADRDDRRLRAVADAFLPSTRDPAAPGAALHLYVAAPGTADTSAVLGAMRPEADEEATGDLGGAVGVRLSRLERGGPLAPLNGRRPLLVWCPCAEEGSSVCSALALGRLGALLQPDRLTVLWFAGPCAGSGAVPSSHQRRWVELLVQAAVPGVAVSLHCLGWDGDAGQQLADLARRFH